MTNSIINSPPIKFPSIKLLPIELLPIELPPIKLPPIDTDFLIVPQKTYDRAGLFFAKVASYATDPICKAHELFRSQQVLKHLHKSSSKLAIIARRVMMITGMILLAIVGAPLALIGILCRKISSAMVV